jgi:AcrR family transcriptional regulator
VAGKKASVARPPSGKATRARRGAGDTAAQIAATARSILDAEGVDAVSMHRLARELDITPMAIYHHYENREALLQRIVADEIAILAALGERLSASGKSSRRLEKMVDAYLDYAFERPHMFDYVFNTFRDGGMKYPKDFRSRRSPSLTPLADRVAGLMEAGTLREDDVWEVTMQLWAHVHGYVTLYRTGRFDMDEKRFRALYHRAAKRLLRGLAPPLAARSTVRLPSQPLPS